MERRKFLQLMGLSTALSATGYFSLPDFEDSVRQIIREDTATLQVSETVVSQFLTDAKKEMLLSGYTPKVKTLITACTAATSLNIHLPISFNYAKYRNRFVHMFLLSTDFFLNKMDDRRPLTYIGIYNPYKRPCSNPFSSVYYPS